MIKEIIDWDYIKNYDVAVLNSVSEDNNIVKTKLLIRNYGLIFFNQRHQEFSIIVINLNNDDDFTQDVQQILNEIAHNNFIILDKGTKYDSPNNPLIQLFDNLQINSKQIIEIYP